MKKNISLENNTKKVVVNTIYSFVSYLLIAIFGIVVRKVFLDTFPIELLGYENLFSSIFSVLSIAELGTGSMFSYMLYKAVSKKDGTELSELMSIYRYVYMIIGIFVGIVGLIIAFNLRIIINVENKNIIYIYIIYFSQLLTICINYFLAYRRALLEVKQMKYRIVKIELLFNLINMVIKIISIVVFKSFIMYIVVSGLINISSIIIVFIFSISQTKEVKIIHIKKDTFKKYNIVKHCREVFISKISTVLYTSSDPIIISLLLSVEKLAYFTNYTLIGSYFRVFLSFFTNSMENAIGNHIWQSNKKSQLVVFQGYDYFSFFIGSLFFSGLVCCMQNFIYIIYGNQYLLSDMIVILIAVDLYITCRGIAYCGFQSAIGHYELSNKFSAFAALFNVIFSIVLGIKYGLSGILLATIIGNILIEIGRTKVARSIYKFETLIKNVRKEITYIVVICVVCLLCVFVSNRLEYSFVNFCIRILICMIVNISVILLILKGKYKDSFVTMFKETINSINKKSIVK